MRAIVWLSIVLLAGCAEPDHDLQLDVSYPERMSGATIVPVDPLGRYLVRIAICVPDLRSARASVIALGELGDAGPAERLATLLAPSTPRAECPEATLAAELRVPAPPAGGPQELEIAVLGERRIELIEVAAVVSGTIDRLTFDPTTIPPAGGVVTGTITTVGAVPGAIVQIRTVPEVPISSRMPSVGSDAQATFVMSIDDETAEVWVEARLGGSIQSTILRR